MCIQGLVHFSPLPPALAIFKLRSHFLPGLAWSGMVCISPCCWDDRCMPLCHWLKWRGRGLAVFLPMPDSNCDPNNFFPNSYDYRLEPPCLDRTKFLKGSFISQRNNFQHIFTFCQIFKFILNYVVLTNCIRLTTIIIKSIQRIFLILNTHGKLKYQKFSCLFLFHYKDL
jgi:hypothetical protein